MADNIHGLKKVRSWSRSEELKRTLTVASLLSQFVDDGLTADGLLKVLNGMATTIDVDNWDDVVNSPSMVALRSAPKTTRVWADHSMSQPWAVGGAGAGVERETMFSLLDARRMIQETLNRIHTNQEAGEPPFTGLNDEHELLDLLEKGGDLKPGRFEFHKDVLRVGTVLEQQHIDGDVMYRLDAVVSTLLREFIETDGWRYLTRCAVCERMFLPRRTDAKTCSPRCRKRLQLDGPRR